MPPLPALSGEEVVRALENGGFKLRRVRGSHHMMSSPLGLFTVVPVHRGKDLQAGTLRAIIRDSGLTVDEFLKLL